MAEQVDVPGLGSMKKSWVIGGVAAAGGVVAYAYWRRASTPQTGPILVDPDDAIGQGDYQPPATGDPGGSRDETGDAIDTDDEWTRAATEYLVGTGGWEPSVIATALGKYLGKLKLKPMEADIVRSAVGAFGYPPKAGALPIQIEDSKPDNNPPKEPGPANPPGMIGNFWTKVQANEKHLSDVVIRVYKLGGKGDTLNIGYDSMVVRMGNPQVDWNKPGHLYPGLDLFIPPIPV